MKRKTACLFLFFAGFMLLAHAVLPHHHHCHQVVFLQSCHQHDLDLHDGHNEDPSAVPCGQEVPEQPDSPVQTQNDPCWQNSQYRPEPSGKISPELALNITFSLLYGSPDRMDTALTAFIFERKKQSVPLHSGLYRSGFHPAASGLRAPPFC